MSKQMTSFVARCLSVGLVLALLVLVTGFSSALTLDVATSFIQAAKLTASDGAVLDIFGRSVSISGDTLVVGASRDDDSGPDSGSAYVFERDAGGLGSWVQVVKLTASDGSEGDYFGDSVSTSGDTIVVGAPYDDDNGSDSGSAYVFVRDEGGPGSWGQVAKLTASDGSEYDEFGYSVSISGDTSVVGAFLHNDGGDWTGSAYVFGQDAGGLGNWGQVAKLSASDIASEAGFGWSVSISGHTLVVGALWDDGNAPGSGSAYLYEKPVAGWTDMTETAKLTASDCAEYGWFGGSVSISGDTLVVGAYHDDDNGLNSGSAYLFEKPGAGWTDMTETARLTASDGAEDDLFGLVSISGDSVAVGALGDDDHGDWSGSAYLFEKPEAGWTDMTETAKLTASDGAEGDRFGRVSISGDTLVVGSYFDDDRGDGSGSAYVFYEFEPIAWIYLPVVLRSAP